MSKSRKRWFDKSVLLFTDWFDKARKSGRGFLTVSPRVIELPCGCKRESMNESLFRIYKTANGWIHVSPDCNQTVSNKIFTAE